mgnify:CR=1 FL=1
MNLAFENLRAAVNFSMEFRREKTLYDLIDLDFLLAENLKAPPETHKLSELVSWLEKKQSEKRNLHGTLLEKSLPSIKKTLLLAGIIFGLISVFAFVIAYYGRPINLFYLFSIQAAFPALMSLYAHYVLFRTKSQKQDSRKTLYHYLSPSLIRIIIRLILKNEALKKSWQKFSRLQIKHARVYQLFIIHLLQTIGFGTAIGALFGFFLLNLFSAPAIGWESAILNESVVYQISRFISWPWSWIQNALPNETMIAATQFHGLAVIQKDFTVMQIDALYRTWWRFIFLAMFFYRFGGRFLSLLFSQLFLLTESRKAWKNLDITLYREKEYGSFINANEEYLNPGKTELPEIPKTINKDQLLSADCCLVWSDSIIFHNLKQSFASMSYKFSDIMAPAGSDFAADKNTLDTIAENKYSEVLLIASVAEPPSAEFLEFLQKLQKISTIKSLTLALTSSNCQTIEKDWFMWRTRLLALADSKTNFVCFEVSDD